MHEGTRFPHADLADEYGLVAVGGLLSVDWLREAYRNGIFPWPIPFNRVAVLAWFSPDPRAVLELSQLHVSRRLRRRIHSGQFQVTCDRDFEAVVAGCSAPRRGDQGTWITSELKVAYGDLHREGLAHSVEVWEHGQLAGGLYGVSMGGLFAGESMFHRRPDASKVALAYLVTHLVNRGFTLFDIQQATDHMVRMGACEVPRRDYLRRLYAARDLPVTFGTPADFPRSADRWEGTGNPTA